MTVLYLRRHKATIFVILNVLFAVIKVSVVGQVGQNVSLPLWIGTATGNPYCTNASNGENNSNTTGASMDPYFVLSSASFSFVIIFGVLSNVGVCCIWKSYQGGSSLSPVAIIIGWRGGRTQRSAGSFCCSSSSHCTISCSLSWSTL